ncbi:FkbM family methyltransferase [filamentous cyanobacterium LEGE 11480]|uniref:FkbM family methyltransferase n=1 Tax=Romeriopsis navalis LEGE 11480 TaxID=2777977 RepID=A0A928Z522_9CYAN|nr:FkbM family methyltransferase [Romeriopsis navalis]MBE9031008.1 FkbM family methyltransferase [Romeriopsis navalis LEGE 11480]
MRAWVDCRLPSRRTYSQQGEDRRLAQMLEPFDLTTGIYIEVGANQPSHLSNTYLFYRRGLQGILVEPDESNYSLLRRFRPRDITVRALAGADSKLCQFNYAIFSVLNSVHALPESQVLRTEYIPQVQLDEIVELVNPEWIYLLSTDTEGHDLAVLQGAEKALERTLLVCAEYHDEVSLSELEDYMAQHDFQPIFRNGLNLFFQNMPLFKRLTNAKDEHLAQHRTALSYSGVID